MAALFTASFRCAAVALIGASAFSGVAVHAQNPARPMGGGASIDGTSGDG